MARVVVIRRNGNPLIVTIDRVRSGFAKDGYEINYRAGCCLGARRKADRQGSRCRSRDGKPGMEMKIAHDVTFAFVAHAFFPEKPDYRGKNNASRLFLRLETPIVAAGHAMPRCVSSERRLNIRFAQRFNIAGP